MASPIRKYLKETRSPVYSAALLLPFFVVYHTGTVLLGTTYVNGADAMIVRILAALSVRSMFASALVLVACFVVWQLYTRANWKVDSGRLALLFGESLAYALLLVLLSGWLITRLSLSVPGRAPNLLEQVVLYCGAGIYEELLFRGFLLGSLVLLFTRAFRMRAVPGAICAALLAALLFSLFHYVGPAGDRFELGSFVQRAAGGLYFSALFVTRGFGVTAAAHALYDVIVGIILA
jgi:membrane protease YdiL (CAAX protease family)